MIVKAGVVVFLLCACAASIIVVIYLESEFNKPEPVVHVPSITTESGIFLAPGIVSDVIKTDAYIHASNTADASAWTDEYNFQHYSLPVTYANNLGMLTTAEAQEYILRVLKDCAPCTINADDLIIDTKVLGLMASAPVQRVEVSELLNDYIVVDLAKYSLDQQRQLAEAGYNSMEAIAISADASQTAIAASGFSATCMPWIAIGVVAIAIMFITLQAKKGEK